MHARWACRKSRAVIHDSAIWVVGGMTGDATDFLNDAWYEETNGAGCVAPEPIVHCDTDNGLRWSRARKQQVRETTL